MPNKERRFPIQGTHCGQQSPCTLWFCGKQGKHQDYGTVPWEIAEKAYEDYSAQYGNRQTLGRLAQRGGFGYEEMDEHFGSERWRDSFVPHTKVNRR